MKYFIERKQPNLWKVYNEEEGETYVVFNGKELVCECKFYRTKHFCKHIRSVVYSLITGINIMEEEE
jgi:hypothetical protein